jgi:hypothetical protein
MARRDRRAPSGTEAVAPEDGPIAVRGGADPLAGLERPFPAIMRNRPEALANGVGGTLAWPPPTESPE